MIFSLFFGIVLFLIGLRLSAFFSGSETGFYRISSLRLNLDAQSGDQNARTLLWFVNHPSYFVGTTLVGNNVANYVTTLAIGMSVASIWSQAGGWLEIVSTLLFAPLIFILGEQVPKYLYYRAPRSLLLKDANLFLWFYRIFLPVSLPMIVLTILMEQFASAGKKEIGLLLGRSRLVQVMSQGRQEGLLTDIQDRLVHGLLNTAGDSVTASMTPANRILGVSDDLTREQILAHAEKYGLNIVAVKHAQTEQDWYGYLHIAKLALERRSVQYLIHTMPEIDPSLTKIETLLILKEHNAQVGVIRHDDSVIGMIFQNGLVEQLFRPPRPASTRIGN